GIRDFHVTGVQPCALPICFANSWMSRCDDGWLLELHPEDEFPGEDPLQVLLGALAASLKGLAHELRNPLAGIKGAGQLLARRVQDAESRELVGPVQAEVARLAALVDERLGPAAPRRDEAINIHAGLERVLAPLEPGAG